LGDRRGRGQTTDPDAQGDRREDQIHDAEREHKPKSLGSRQGDPNPHFSNGPVPPSAFGRC